MSALPSRQGRPATGGVAGASCSGPAGRSAEHPPVVPARTPPPGRFLLSPRLPAFWLVLVLGVMGGWRLSLIFLDAIRLYPRASVAAAVLFGLYAIPFVLVVREVDYLEREPLALRLTALMWGGVIATAMANVGNVAAQDIIAKVTSPSFSDRWTPAIVGPTNEETLKALGVVAIVLLARRQVNSVVDGFVYGATVGLGFQVVEDFVYAINAVGLAGNGDQVTPVIAVFLVRGFIGGLWSHTLFTALAGAGIGYAVVRADRTWPRRIGVAALAFLGAWTLHFVWNSPLLADGFGAGPLGVVGGLLLKGIPGLVAVLFLLRIARRHEATYYTGLLTGVEPVLVAPGELDALVTRRGRAAARKNAGAVAGLTAERSVRRLQRAQARLAVEISRSGHSSYRQAVRSLAERYAGTDGLINLSEVWVDAHEPPMERCVRQILEIREQLMALGIDAAGRHGREQRTALGGWSIAFGALGLVLPGPSLVAMLIAAIGSALARRNRITSDSRLAVGTMLGMLGVLLWSVALLILRLRGG